MPAGQISKVVTAVLSIFTVKRLYLIYGAPLILALCLLSVFGVFHQPELFFLDRAFEWRPKQDPSPHIAIVAISQQDFEQGAPRWPWPRSLMARLIDQVSSYRPSVIAIDILYTERSSSESVVTQDQFEQVQRYIYHVLSGNPIEVKNPEGTLVIGPGVPVFDQIVAGRDSARSQDLELANAVRRAIEDGVPVVLAAQTVSGIRVSGLDEPYPELLDAAGGSVGLVGILSDSDGVLRRYLPYGRDKDGAYVYALGLAAVANFEQATLPRSPLDNGDVPIGDSTLVRARDGSFLVNFRGPPGIYTTSSAGEILRGELDFSQSLAGKIVFIGVTDPSSEDLRPTPLSGSKRMAGVEFHAAATDTILSGSYIASAPLYQRLLIVVALGIGAIALGRFPRPLFGGAGVLLAAGALFGGWLWSFAGANYLLPLAASLTALGSGYAFALTDRVGVEQLEKQQARSMLSRYLPPDVVRTMLKNPVEAQLGGRRAELTVLFSDIRGFTTLSEKLEPEQVVSLLNEYLTAMTDIIFRHGGTVDKFEGDAILVFFGAPQYHEDHAERAVNTALAMQERLADFEEKWMELTQSSLNIGIGIHSGDVMVGNIGSQRRMEYTVIGDTVNLASRLQDLTKVYDASILISDSTHHRVSHMCQAQSLGSVEIRGRQQPVNIYQVSGLNNSPTPVGREAQQTT
ncbi:MAG: CHASE2 domain-containing protein [Chloroflexi bacterium]|nr:CHASE2 domain-containing protein [Chloroflexota bacterium]MCH8349308.1 CHASE2 domain-containing protein [Chloroflexota bacterium]MCI0780270.1 CHASE2 domain-containing protein [Chloroflexota bacterium]MCI0786451.1 CHASE2 domain-containing protein [Chloroflexota bacterium]MCI0795015.1 CHASE2 domain-containing protein [Chloroflexota bacterium]